MKSFISDYLVSLAAPYHTITNLFEFQFAQTLYFTSFPQNIPYDSHWWKHKAISFDEARLSMGSSVDSLDLIIPNVDKWFSTLALAESLVGKPVFIYQAALDNNNHVILAELIFFGYVDKRGFNQVKGTMPVKNHMALWRKQTPPLHTPSCRWIFKNRADEVIGSPDGLNYRCLVDHPAVAANRPNGGAVSSQFWTQIGNQGVTWITGTQYQSGSCQFPGRYLAFTLGGTHVLAQGETITQGAASAVIYDIQLDSGAWALATAAGVLTFVSQTGAFSAGIIQQGGVNVGTMTGDSIAPANYICDQSWEACKKYGNDVNFGGNRWLPWLEDPANRIYWGKYPPRNA